WSVLDFVGPCSVTATDGVCLARCHHLKLAGDLQFVADIVLGFAAALFNFF
ncbi:hypothetical protein A2U01_0101495, partial [Trifolium medium]|nr:hypothetical protein [Trifolium medium]